MQLTESQVQALDITRHICVTAGAGSGKTTVLVERYLKILHEGNATPREIVAITFTEKAAAEMKERIIERLAGEDENRDESFSEEINTAPISTIHAFCARILREFPFQANVPANFSILQGIDQKLLLEQAIQKTLKDIATNADDKHRDELTRLLQCCRSRDNLEDLLSAMVTQRETIERLKKRIYGNQPSDAEGGICPRDAGDHACVRRKWEELIIEQLTEDFDGWINKWHCCLKAVSEVAKGKRNAEKVKNLTQHLASTTECRDSEIAPTAERLPTVLKHLRKISDLITTQAGGIAKRDFLGSGVDTTGLEAEIDFLVSAAKKIKAIPPLNDDDDFLIATTHDLLTLYERIKNVYQRDKLSQGKLDYTDLQLETRDLLQDNEEIRQKLRARYQYYMVDEYQDTNRLQAELVMLLTNDLQCANLFIVGDAKQGIYRFRGADIQVFNETRENIIGLGGEAIGLRENFRSLQDVVGFVNLFFQQLMGDGGESEFEVSYEPLIKARPDDVSGGVEIILSDKNMEQEGDEVVGGICPRKAGDDTLSENALIARRIKSLKANGTKYGDIAILIRSRRHLPDIEHALLEEGIPYLTTGGIGFYQRQEIYDIWNYLKFLDAPTESDVSLAAILRGPCFGISDSELYEISQQQGKSFWDKGQRYLQHSATASDALKTAIACLKRHRQIARRLPVNQLIITIVNETGLIGTLQTGKQGQQRWVNYQKLLDLARHRDSDIAPTREVRNPPALGEEHSLATFIKFLDVLIDEEPREGQAPIEPSEGAVNIMTIHAAKGLQFPVVILPCLEKRVSSDSEPFIDELLGIGFSPLKMTKDDSYVKSEPSIVKIMKSRAQAKTEAEKKRLFYVAATRAKDRLILSGTCSGNPSNFLKWLYEYLCIAKQDALCLPVRLEVLSDNNPSIHSFNLPIPIIRQLEDTPPPPALGDGASDESPPVEFPEHPCPALTPQPIGAHFSVTELANYARCPMRYQLENVLRIPPLDTVKAGPDPLIDIESVVSETEEWHSFGDWDGTKRGRAVHNILMKIRRQDDRGQLDKLIRQASQDSRVAAEASAEQAKTLRTPLNNFLDSEIGETALSASETYTERLIRAELGKHIVAGGLDRIFKDETGHWQVIDYKTDQITKDELADRVAHYRPQMELYAWLVHTCYPAQPTVTVNLFFTALNRCEPLHFSRTELQENANQWEEKITELQQGIYEKDLTHCAFCPYADNEQQCIVSEL